MTQSRGTIGVVIPGFGHPQFLAEAIASAAEQDTEQPVKVVIIDDGCRFADTAAISRAMLARYPGRVHFLRQPNGRLPAARNAGIRFLLALEDHLDAVFFLDADNRLSPYSLRQYRAALGDDPAVGWAYPDISFFGLNVAPEGFNIRETAPHYSPLLHLIGNISEAGSLVRADVLRCGLLFDESLRDGFEDWDYWLSLLQAGYRGARTADAGFFYRRRPASMLVDARYHQEALVTRLRQKHAALFAPRALMRRLAAEAPRLACHVEDKGVYRFTDPLAVGPPHPLADFMAEIQGWLDDPRDGFFADMIMLASASAWAALTARPERLRALIWRLETLARERPVAVQFAADRTERIHTGGSADTLSSADLCVLSRAHLSRLIYRGLPALDIAGAIFSLDDWPAEPAAADQRDALAAFATRLQQALSLAVPSRHRERVYTGPDASALYTVLVEEICADKAAPPYPAALPGPRILVAVDQALVLQAGDLTALKARLAALREAGAETGLLILHQDDYEPARIRAALAGLADDITALESGRTARDYTLYLGHRLHRELPPLVREQAGILAKSADLLLSVGSSGLIEVFGYARHYGIKGYVDLNTAAALGQRFDVAPLLAYEHAIAGYIGDSVRLRPVLASAGVPPGKVTDFKALLAEI